MEVGVLGPLRARHGCRDAAPKAPKPRQVLSLLVLHSGTPISSARIIEELWGTRPPKTALTTTQTYILQLRKLLAEVLQVPAGDIAKDVLATDEGGYVLDLAYASFDLTRYLQLEASGIRALSDGNNVGAAAAFDSALSLWRGRVLANVDHGPLLRVEVAGLEQSHAALIGYRIESRLRLAGHRELLAELAKRVIEEPYNEHRHAQFMLALYRSGYRHKALEVYRGLRASMVEELGVEPAPQLQWLHGAILAAAPQLDDPSDIEWSGFGAIAKGPATFAMLPAPRQGEAPY